ncbi:unnamed protein product, partial [Ectocarpus sp. 12 AP-2014]
LPSPRLLRCFRTDGVAKTPDQDLACYRGARGRRVQRTGLLRCPAAGGHTGRYLHQPAVVPPPPSPGHLLLPLESATAAAAAAAQSPPSSARTAPGPRRARCRRRQQRPRTALSAWAPARRARMSTPGLARPLLQLLSPQDAEKGLLLLEPGP